MAKRNLQIVSIRNRPALQPERGNAPLSGCAANSAIHSEPDEALRLVRAFTRISDPEQRARLIADTEKIAGV